MKHHCYDNMLHVSHSVSVISIRMSAFVFRIWLENVEMVQCFGGFWLFLTRGLIWHLSKSSIRPSICFSLIVRSRLNPFLETTNTKSNKGNVSFSWKQRGGGGSLLGLEPMTFTLQVRRATLTASVEYTQCTLWGRHIA